MLGNKLQEKKKKKGKKRRKKLVLEEVNASGIPLCWFVTGEKDE